MTTIDLEDSIYTLVNNHPEIKNVLFELGFKDIVKPGMLQTVGKFTNLKKGSVIQRIELKKIVEKLEAAGFSVK